MIKRENQKTTTETQNIDTQQSPGRFICRHLCDLLCPPKNDLSYQIVYSKRGLSEIPQIIKMVVYKASGSVFLLELSFSEGPQKDTIGGLRNAQVFIVHNV